MRTTSKWGPLMLCPVPAAAARCSSGRRLRQRGGWRGRVGGTAGAVSQATQPKFAVGRTQHMTPPSLVKLPLHAWAPKMANSILFFPASSAQLGIGSPMLWLASDTHENAPSAGTADCHGVRYSGQGCPAKRNDADRPSPRYHTPRGVMPDVPLSRSGTVSQRLWHAAARCGSCRRFSLRTRRHPQPPRTRRGGRSGAGWLNIRPY